MKYFMNIQTGIIEEVKNEKVIEQMEKYPEVYKPCAKPGDKTEKPAKEAKAPKEAEAPKAAK